VEMLRHYKKALEFDIHCRFAEFLCALDEPELGSLLLPAAAAKSLSAATDHISLALGNRGLDRR
jgi:hypothetical protein